MPTPMKMVDIIQEMEKFRDEFERVPTFHLSATPTPFSDETVWSVGADGYNWKFVPGYTMPRWLKDVRRYLEALADYHEEAE